MKLNNLTISIVTYHRPSQLNSCLKSILRQKYQPYQIQIIDNDYQKSAQKTFQKYQSNNHLKYFCQPQKGISRSRNFAINNCQTKYLAFIDDDCRLSPNWSHFVRQIINSNPESVFFQGGVKLQKTSNPITIAQQKNYQNWINSNTKKHYFHPLGLDTKNLILNLDKIKNLNTKFDPNFPIFEDTDFGLQLAQYHQTGVYFPQISVYHPYSTDFLKTIKKYFYQGKIKYSLNQKWHNFDNFKPPFFSNPKEIIKNPSNFFPYLFNQSFNLGFLIAKHHRYQPNHNTIFIVNRIDQSANGQRCSELKKFLKNHDYQINLINSQDIFQREFKNPINFLYQPIIYPTYRILRFLTYQIYKKINQSSYAFYLELLVRGKILKRFLSKKKAELIICQYPEDLAIGLNRNLKIIFDLPTIYSLETQNPHITKIETKIFNQDYPICFHWYSLLNLTQKIKLKPKNGFILNWGCHLQKKLANFHLKTKIVHIGKLNSSWVNPALLQNIQNQLPLDIYSYEKPDPQLYHNLKILGFTKKLSKLNQYQFGLITIANNQLRNHGFSAKHLMYFSFGLPVLCPEWRRDSILSSGTIYYNESNLKSQIKKYSQKKLWIKKHQAAIKIAKNLGWEKTLEPILVIIPQYLK